MDTPAPSPPQERVNPAGRRYTVMEGRGGSVSSHRGGLQLQWQLSRALVEPHPLIRWCPGETVPKFRLFCQPLTRGNEAGFLAGAGAKGWLGFWIVRRTMPSPLLPGQLADYEVRDVFVPYWPLAAATAALPLARLVAALRRRARRRSGVCTQCGYDLRATSGTVSVRHGGTYPHPAAGVIRCPAVARVIKSISITPAPPIPQPG